MICNDANFGHWQRVLYNINDTDDILRKCSESTIEHPVAWRILALWVAPLQAVPRLGAAWSRSFPKTGIKPSEMNSHQKHPETSRNIQKYPGTSRNIQKHPETSRNIQKHPETSRNIQTPPFNRFNNLHMRKKKYCEWLLYSCMNIICIREEGKAVDTSRSRPPTLHLFLIATVNGLQLLPTSFSLLFLRSYLVLQPKCVLNNIINTYIYNMMQYE